MLNTQGIALEISYNIHYGIRRAQGVGIAGTTVIFIILYGLEGVDGHWSKLIM
jgi:hypothetical protein